MSIVIPCVRILIRTLEKNENDSGICTMKGELLKSLKSCFARIEERKELCLASGYPIGPQVQRQIFFREYYQSHSQRDAG